LSLIHQNSSCGKNINSSSTGDHTKVTQFADVTKQVPWTNKMTLKLQFALCDLSY